MTLVDTKRWATRSLFGALLLISCSQFQPICWPKNVHSRSQMCNALVLLPSCLPQTRLLSYVTFLTASKTAALTFYTSRATFEAAFPVH